MITTIYNVSIYAEDTKIDDGFISFENGIIKNFGQRRNHKKTTDEVMIDGAYGVVLPGMIDIHIHGANGADVMDGTPAALKTIASSVVREGTTSFLATTMTQHPDLITKALKNVSDYVSTQKNDGEAEIIGIHLEGPFLNKERAGAQPSEYIVDPNYAIFQKYQKAAGGLIKVVTVAPECGEGPDFITAIVKDGVIASIGHSGATFCDATCAMKAGAKHVTHLYNGLTPLHHREAGVIGAALMSDEQFVEMIVDGQHISPEVVKLTYKIKGAEKILLITDAMRAKYLSDGEYDLGGQTVCVRAGKATLPEGALAGSTLKMDQALLNMLQFTNCSLHEITLMTAKNQAKQLGIFDRKGSINIGKDADIILLDGNNKLKMTVCRGVIAYNE